MNSLLKGVTAFLISVMVLVGYTNIPKLVQNYNDMVVIKDAVLRSAKYEGGFQNRTLDLLNKRINESTLDSNKLKVTLSPGENVTVNKKEKLAINIEYQFEYKILTLTGVQNILRPINIKDYTYSQKYFK